MTESLAFRPPCLAVPTSRVTRFALGCEPLDAALGGGIAQARLHEIYAGTETDATAAAGFALMLALRAGGPEGTIVWIEEGRRHPPLYGPGLVELGVDPARLLLVTVPDEATLLRVAADVVRSPAAGTAVIAPGPRPKRLDLTATRRLTLFAERSGVTAILLRGAGAERSSAAATRWRVAAAPSPALEADAPGLPTFAADLVRRRDGVPSPGWRVAWDRDARAFLSADAKLPRAVPADLGDRRLAAG